MRKVEIGVICIALCIALALILPRIGTSYEEVTKEEGCGACHDFSFASDIHSDHNEAFDNDCGMCHPDGNSSNTPPSSKCLACHPADDSDVCDLADLHEGSPDYAPSGDSCYAANCHADCEPDDTTTTSIVATTTVQATTSIQVTTTTSIKPCLSQALYGENSAEVEVLRYVRDNVLSATPEGQEIIRLYYQLSPLVVTAMQNDPAFKAEVKEVVDGVLGLVTQ